MNLSFWRKPAPPVLEPEPELLLDPVDRKYEGPVGFGSDGVHYPVSFDEDGNELGLDFTQPLRYNADGNGWFFYHALEDEPTHFHKYHVGHVDITPES